MDSPIKDIRDRTKELILLILTAIFLAFSVDTWGSILFILFDENVVILGFLSLFLFIISSLFFYKFFLSNETINIKLEGIIAYEFINNQLKPIEIYGYDFNDNFNSALESLFNENEKYIEIFNDEKSNREAIEKNYKYDPSVLSKKNIINSILEYLILEKLSVHLDDYYTKNEISGEKIIRITTKEFDSHALENRIFLENGVIQNIIKEEFEINLPKNSKITRNSDDYLEINNEIFNIIIIPDYQGFNEFIDPILTDYKDKDQQYPFYSFDIKLRIIIKRHVLFNDDYGWLDSFLNEAYEYVSIEYIRKKIDPDLLKYLSKIIK
jgi:hypothetical protein